MVRILEDEAVGEVDQQLGTRHQLEDEAVLGAEQELIVEVGGFGCGVAGAAAVVAPVDVVVPVEVVPLPWSWCCHP